MRITGYWLEEVCTGFEFQMQIAHNYRYIQKGLVRSRSFIPLKYAKYRCDTQMRRNILCLKRLSDASELRLANTSFALNDSTVMKLSSKGICVAVLRNPALSLVPELPTIQDMALQTAIEFSPGGSANGRGSASPVDIAIPHRKK